MFEEENGENLHHDDFDWYFWADFVEKKIQDQGEKIQELQQEPPRRAEMIENLFSMARGEIGTIVDQGKIMLDREVRTVENQVAILKNEVQAELGKTTEKAKIYVVQEIEIARRGFEDAKQKFLADSEDFAQNLEKKDAGTIVEFCKFTGKRSFAQFFRAFGGPKRPGFGPGKRGAGGGSAYATCFATGQRLSSRPGGPGARGGAPGGNAKKFGNFCQAGGGEQKCNFGARKEYGKNFDGVVHPHELG
jgi:hypothetical protein